MHALCPQQSEVLKPVGPAEKTWHQGWDSSQVLVSKDASPLPPQEGAGHFHPLFPYEVLLLMVLPRLLKTFWENESQIELRETTGRWNIHISQRSWVLYLLSIVSKAGRLPLMQSAQSCWQTNTSGRTYHNESIRSRTGGLPQQFEGEHGVIPDSCVSFH